MFSYQFDILSISSWITNLILIIFAKNVFSTLIRNIVTVLLVLYFISSSPHLSLSLSLKRQSTEFW